ncbi:MAG: diacylglycerol kinase family lipid kinase [Bacteroidia bacterium]|nr:diacylglycerol kinase family lipid kinase [Bacteroidia bacterium]
MPETEKWLVIVNPNAGYGYGKKSSDQISKLLTESGFNFFTVFTTHRYHAVFLVCDYIIKGYRKIIVVGGDGTLNEVANGIFMQKTCPTTDITLAIIPIGTGNDWRKTYQIPDSISEAIELIKRGKTFCQDTGLVSYFENGKQRKSHFINIAGIGFDSYIVEKTNEQKESGRSGKMLYLFNLFKHLLQYKIRQCEVTIDDSLYSGKTMSLCAGIGKYNGGGMMPLPESIPDDGLFDISIFENVTKWEVIKNLKKLYNGNIYNFKKVLKRQGKTITVRFSTPVRVEADGELFGYCPLKFEIIPQSLKIITGA